MYKLKTRKDIASYFRKKNLYKAIKSGMTGKGEQPAASIYHVIRELIKARDTDTEGEGLGAEELLFGLPHDEVEFIFLTSFSSMINTQPGDLIALAKTETPSVLLVEDYGDERYLIHFDGHFHDINAAEAELEIYGHEVKRGLHLPSEEFDDAFRNYLDKMDRAGDEFREVIIPREGWNSLSGSMELIIMFPYAVMGADGQCCAEVYPIDGYRASADGLLLMDYDGVMKRTSAVELTEELCESYGAQFSDYMDTDQGSSYKLVRKQRHQEVYEGFAKLAYFGKKWDGYEVVDKDAVSECYEVLVLRNEHNLAEYKVKVVATSKAAAEAKVNAMDDLDWENQEQIANNLQMVTGQQIVEVAMVHPEPSPEYLGEDLTPCQDGCVVGCGVCETAPDVTAEDEPLTGGQHPMGGMIEDAEPVTLGILHPDGVQDTSEGLVVTLDGETFKEDAEVPKHMVDGNETVDRMDRGEGVKEVVAETRSYILIHVQDNLVTKRQPMSVEPVGANNVLTYQRSLPQQSGNEFEIALLQVMDNGKLVNVENGMEVIIGSPVTNELVDGEQYSTYNEFPVGKAPSKEG